MLTNLLESLGLSEQAVHFFFTTIDCCITQDAKKEFLKGILSTIQKASLFDPVTDEMILKEIARLYLTLQCALPAKKENTPLFMAIFSTLSGEETATLLQAYSSAKLSLSFPTLSAYKTALFDFVEGCTSREDQAFASGMLDSPRNLHALFSTVEKGTGFALFPERACKAMLTQAMDFAHRVRARYPLPAPSTAAFAPPELTGAAPGPAAASADLYTSADWVPPIGK